MPVLVLFPPALAPPAVRVAGFPFRVSPVLATLVRHSRWSARSASPVRLPFRCAPRARCAAVRSRSRGIRATPRPPSFLRAHSARSPRRAPVEPFQLVHAAPRFPSGSLALPAMDQKDVHAEVVAVAEGVGVGGGSKANAADDSKGAVSEAVVGEDVALQAGSAGTAAAGSKTAAEL